MRLWRWSVVFLFGASAAVGFGMRLDDMALRDSLRAMPRWKQVRWLAERGLPDPYLRDCTPVGDSGLRCVGRWSYGPSTWVDIRATPTDTIVFLSRGSGVSIIRFRSQDSLRLDLLSDINSHGLTSRCQVRDTLLYVNSGGVECYDINDLTHPTLLNWLSQPLIYDLFVVDTLLYTSSRDSLRIFSVSDPASPRWLGACADSGYVMYVSGNYAYLGHQAGLFILDVKNPTAPHRVASLGYDVLSISVKDTLLYFGTTEFALRVYNVKDPATPFPVGSLTGIEAHDIYLPQTCDTVLYTPKLHVINIVDPGSPRQIGFASCPGWDYGVRAVPALNYALVADYFDGLVAVDIGNPTVPLVDTSVFSAGSSEDICIDNGKAYVAQYFCGMRILDVTNPSAPRLLGAYDTTGQTPPTRAIVARDSLAYFGWTWPPYLHAFDVTDPAKPVMQGGADVSNPPEDMVLLDSLIYVAEVARFQVVNVARPREPVLVGSCVLSGDARGVDLEDTVAYVGMGSGGLVCINVANPNVPMVIGTWGGRTGGVDVSDTLAFVAGPYTGCACLSVANPAAPYVLDSLYLEQWWNDIAVADSLVFVGGTWIHVVDASDPRNLRVVGTWTPPGLVRRLEYHTPYLYAACYEAGVCILETVQVGVGEELGSARLVQRPGTLCPNPASKYATLRAEPGIESAVMRDVLGRMVMTFRPSGTVFTMDLAGLRPGLYFIELRYNTGKRVEKLIKR